MGIVKEGTSYSHFSYFWQVISECLAYFYPRIICGHEIYICKLLNIIDIDKCH